MRFVITCVYWEGKFRKRNYAPGWALRIKSMAERRMKSNFDFVVMTNVPHRFPSEVNTVELLSEVPGWWAKLEAFDPGVFGTSRVLLLDLDLVIMKDLTPLFDHEGEFCLANTVGPFNRLVRPGMHSAGVIVFDAGSALTVRIWEDFFLQDKEAHMKNYRGDGRFLDRWTSHFTRFPEGWVTKLRYCPENGNLPTKKAKIIHCMPWKNDIAAKKFKWVREVWQ